MFCVGCGNEVSKEEIEDYRDELSSLEEAMFDDSGLCPECFDRVK